MPISRSPGQKGDLIVYASPLSAEGFAALKQWGKMLMCARTHAAPAHNECRALR